MVFLLRLSLFKIILINFDKLCFQGFEFSTNFYSNIFEEMSKRDLLPQNKVSKAWFLFEFFMILVQTFYVSNKL